MDKALISLGFKKEAGEATRTWKDQLKSGEINFAESLTWWWGV